MQQVSYKPWLSVPTILVRAQQLVYVWQIENTAKMFKTSSPLQFRTFGLEMVLSTVGFFYGNRSALRIKQEKKSTNYTEIKGKATENHVVGLNTKISTKYRQLKSMAFEKNSITQPGGIDPRH